MEIESMTLIGKDVLSLNHDPENKKFPWYVALYKEGDKTVFVHEHELEDMAREEFKGWRHMEVAESRDRGTRYSGNYMKNHAGIATAMGRLRFKAEHP